MVINGHLECLVPEGMIGRNRNLWFVRLVRAIFTDLPDHPATTLNPNPNQAPTPAFSADAYRAKRRTATSLQQSQDAVNGIKERRPPPALIVVYPSTVAADSNGPPK